MAKSFRIDAKTKSLKDAKEFDQLLYGDSLVSADHLAKCVAKSVKTEALMLVKLKITDSRSK